MVLWYTLFKILIFLYLLFSVYTDKRIFPRQMWRFENKRQIKAYVTWIDKIFQSTWKMKTVFLFGVILQIFLIDNDEYLS